MRPLVLTFADAIARFGKELKEESLQEAYRRAGKSFGGLLQQHFVVLKNENEPAPVGNRRTGLGLGMGTNVNENEIGNRTPAKKRPNVLLRGVNEGKDAKMTKK